MNKIEDKNKYMSMLMISILGGVIVNSGFGFISYIFGLPLYLDTIGTIGVASVAGVLPAKTFLFFLPKCYFSHITHSKSTKYNKSRVKAPQSAINQTIMPSPTPYGEISALLPKTRIPHPAVPMRQQSPGTIRAAMHFFQPTRDGNLREMK